MMKCSNKITITMRIIEFIKWEWNRGVGNPGEKSRLKVILSIFIPSILIAGIILYFHAGTLVCRLLDPTYKDCVMGGLLISIAFLLSIIIFIAICTCCCLIFRDCNNTYNEYASYEERTKLISKYGENFVKIVLNFE